MSLPDEDFAILASAGERQFFIDMRGAGWLLSAFIIR